MLAECYYNTIDYRLHLLITSIICRGDVVTMECVEKVIKKDMMHPLTGTKLTEKDIIPLERVIKLMGSKHTLGENFFLVDL